MYDKQVDGLQDVVLDGLDECDEDIEASCGARCDHYPPDEHHDASHSSHNQIPHAIAPHDLESVFGGHAEVLASEGDLDVSCLVDELNNSLHAGQTAPQAVDDILETLVLVGASLFSLFLEHFQHHLQKLNNSQDERPEGQAPEVISESPPETAGHWGIQLVVGAVAEIPHAAS